MGWYGGFASKDAIEKECTASGQLGDSGTFRTLEFAWRGNCLWMLQEFLPRQGKSQGPFISLALLEKRGEEWSYKPMDESCGPFYYSVPKHYLEKATSGVHPKWRHAVLTGGTL